jgi:hypothetical protein
MREELLRSTKLFVDETTAPVLDPGRGRTKKGYFWALARDEPTMAKTASKPAVASPGVSGSTGAQARTCWVLGLSDKCSAVPAGAPEEALKLTRKAGVPIRMHPSVLRLLLVRIERGLGFVVGMLAPNGQRTQLGIAANGKRWRGEATRAIDQNTGYQTALATWFVNPILCNLMRRQLEEEGYFDVLNEMMKRTKGAAEEQNRQNANH